MAREHLLRRLVAVFAADAAGYSRLTGADEEGTHVRLREHLQGLFTPNIAAHSGTIIKKTGDGLLAEFDSVVDAVRCAIDVQRGMAERNAAIPPNERIEFRIGINVGDIIKDEGDIFGDAVNVAVRVEAIAEPGGICLSDDAHRNVRNKLDVAFDDVGEQRLKNIECPVRVFRVRDRGIAASQRPSLALPDKPSIAVLPFHNLSADSEQEYFADGIAEDITMALSRFRWLFVIARNSSFTYKGRAVDVKQVGRELGVHYVLEGSVRKAGSRIRIAGQLIDAGSGALLWADRFDGALKDMFDLQDQVTTSVVNAIAPKLQRAEIERAKRKTPENLNAYDCYMRGIASAHRWARDADTDALQLFYKAIELDPELASAYGMAAWCYCRRKANNWMVDLESESAEAMRLARKGARLDQNDPIALCMGGYAIAYIAHEFDDAVALMDRAIAVNPNHAYAWSFSAWLRIWRGEPDLAFAHVGHAMRLSPIDPAMFAMQGAMAYAHFLVGGYEEAALWAERSTRERPNFLLSMCSSAASSALTGQPELAHRAMARIRERDPNLRLSNLKDLTPFRRREDLAIFADGLRKAGLPD